MTRQTARTARHVGQSYRTGGRIGVKCSREPLVLPSPRSQQGQGSLGCKLPLALWPAARVLGLLGLNLPPAVAAVADDSISATSAGVMKKRSSWHTRIQAGRKSKHTRKTKEMERSKAVARPKRPKVQYIHGIGGCIDKLIGYKKRSAV